MKKSKREKLAPCAPCDVKTMGERLNLSERRVQQLEKQRLFRKFKDGRYDCPYNVAAYVRELSQNRQGKASGLTKKREDALEIRNQKERMRALADWDVLVLQEAVVQELAPIIVALKNGFRELRSSMANQIWQFTKEQAEPILDKRISDHEGIAQVQDMLGKPMDEKLGAFAREIEAWEERKNGEKI